VDADRSTPFGGSAVFGSFVADDPSGGTEDPWLCGPGFRRLCLCRGACLSNSINETRWRDPSGQDRGPPPAPTHADRVPTAHACPPPGTSSPSALHLPPGRPRQQGLCLFPSVRREACTQRPLERRVEVDPSPWNTGGHHASQTSATFVPSLPALPPPVGAGGSRRMRLGLRTGARPGTFRRSAGGPAARQSTFSVGPRGARRCPAHSAPAWHRLQSRSTHRSAGIRR
jgi:hypothetical protein